MTDWENDPQLASKIRQARFKRQQRLACLTPDEREAINKTMSKSAYDKFIESNERLEDDAKAIAYLIALDRKNR